MASPNITVADIVAAFGAYYINSKQNQSDIIHKIYQPSETAELFMPITTEDSVIRRGMIKTTKVLQAFQKAWTPLGDATFSGRQIDLHRFKVDLEVYPDDVMDTWVAFLGSLTELDRTKWPFIRFWIEQEVIPTFIEEFDLDVIFKGERAAVVPGTPLPGAQAIDGLRKIINDGIDAGDIIPIVTGALETDPVAFCEQVEAFAMAIPKLHRRFMKVLAMSDTLFQRYQTGADLKYNQSYRQMNEYEVKYAGLIVKGYTSHEDSDKIWCTPYGNAIIGTRRSKIEGTFEIEKVDRKVKLYTEMDRGLGIWDPRIFYTNDQDLSA